jgi:hypothetical protein
MTTTVRQPRL